MKLDILNQLVTVWNNLQLWISNLKFFPQVTIISLFVIPVTLVLAIILKKIVYLILKPFNKLHTNEIANSQEDIIMDMENTGKSNKKPRFTLVTFILCLFIVLLIFFFLN